MFMQATLFKHNGHTERERVLPGDRRRSVWVEGVIKQSYSEWMGQKYILDIYGAVKEQSK